MRLVYKQYSDGTYKLYETDENGRNQRVLEGDVSNGDKVNRVPVFIELSCDADRVEAAKDGLERLSKNLQKVQ